MRGRSGAIRLLGKHLGVPAHVLLGGALRQEIDVAYPIPAHTRKEDVPKSIDYVGHMLGRGYSLVRFYIGLNLEADALFLDQFRKQLDDRVKIETLDCNSHLDWKDARAAIRKFSDYGFMLVESPARRGDLDGLREVRRSIDEPVSDHAYTIADAQRLAAASAVDVFNITMVGAGGFIKALRIAAIAEMNGIRCVLGGAHELALGAAGLAHFGAGLPHLAFPIDSSGTIIYAIRLRPQLRCTTKESCESRWAQGYASKLMKSGCWNLPQLDLASFRLRSYRRPSYVLRQTTS